MSRARSFLLCGTLKVDREEKNGLKKAVRPVLDLWRAGAGPVAGSGRALPRHSRDTAYGCSLPGLTGFTAPGRAGPDHQRCLPGAARSSSGRRRVLSPACRGFPVQGTPSPPPSTASQRIAAARLLPTLRPGARRDGNQLRNSGANCHLGPVVVGIALLVVGERAVPEASLGGQVAETKGFEPLDLLRGHTLSRRAG